MELAPGQMMEVVLEGFSSTPQEVREQLLCQAAVGSEARSTQILQVELSCQFVAPALQMSSTAISFRVEKRAGDVLSPVAQPLCLKNICPLPLSMVLALEQPFSLWDVEQQPLPADAEPVKLEVGQELPLWISFNPAQEEGLSCWQVEQALRIQFLEHPREEQVLVRGEVYLPSLHFRTTAVDFGCILNGTGAVRSLEMTNCSPLPVCYCWQLLPASQGSQLRCSLPAQAVREERACGQRLASAGSSSRAGGVEGPAQALGAAGDPAQEPADAQHCLEAELLPSAREQEGAPEGAVEAPSPGGMRQLKLKETEPPRLGLEELWDSVLEAEVTLQNRGKVPFIFRVLSPGTAAARSPLPGVPLVVPSTGCLGAGQQQVLKVSYLPGVPGLFCKAFQLQVGHLEAEEICLRGEGSFPRICLDLPRNIQGNKKYEQLLRELRGETSQDSERDRAHVLGEAAAAEPAPYDLDAMVGQLQAGCAQHITGSLQSEAEVVFQQPPVKCQGSRVSSQLPPEEAPAWDDSLHASRGLDTTQGPAGLSRGSCWRQRQGQRQLSVLESSSHEVQL